MKFELSRDPLANEHYLELVAEEFLSLTIIEMADLQKSIKEQIKASNDEQDKLRNIEIERFRVESCTEDKLKGIVENPHIAAVPLNNICMAPPGYKFDEDGSFVLDEETIRIPKTVEQVPSVTGCYSWYEDKKMWGNTYWFWETDLQSGKANKIPCDNAGNRLGGFTVFYVSEKPETIDPFFMERQ